MSREDYTFGLVVDGEEVMRSKELITLEVEAERIGAELKQSPLRTIQIVIRHGVQIVIRVEFNIIGRFPASVGDKSAYILKRLIANDTF